MPRKRSLSPIARDRDGVSGHEQHARQRRVHTRSRTGCLVCRQRHKRCDENFVNGACERCRNSGFECVPTYEGRKYTYSQRLKSESAARDLDPGPAHSNQELAPRETVTEDPVRQDGEAGLGSTTSTSTGVFESLFPTIGLYGPDNGLPSTSFGTSFPRVTASAPHAAQSGLEEGGSREGLGSGGDIAEVGGLDSTGLLSSDLSDFISSLFTPLYPTQSTQTHLDYSDTQPNVNTEYSAHSTNTQNQNTNPNPIVSSTLPQEGSDNSIFFLPPSDLSLASFAAQLPAMPDQGTVTPTNHNQVPPTRPQTPEAILNDKEVVSAWRVAMRSRRGKAGKGQQSNRHEGNQGGKERDANGTDKTIKWQDVAKRYQDYVVSWYPKTPDRMRRLTRCDPSNGESPLQATTRGAVLEALKARAEGHGAKNNLGKVYHDFALSLLGEPGSFSLSDTLTAISDLQTYNFLVAGAAAAYAALKVGEAVVRATMGPQPILDLVGAVHRGDMPLVVFSQADLCHCLTTRNRRPIFSPSPTSVKGIHTQLADIIDDMPYAIPLLLSEIIHQILYFPLSSIPSEQAQMWEQQIRGLYDDPEIPLVWSRTTLLILYHRVHHVGPLHPVVRELSWDIIHALEARPCTKNESFPLFLAGTNSLHTIMRGAVRERWVQAPEKGFEEPLVFLEMLWNEMDRTGRTIDWLEYLEEKKKTLAFF